MPKKIYMDLERLKTRYLHLVFRNGKCIPILAREFHASISTIKKTLCDMGLNGKEILYDHEQPFNQRMIKMYETMSTKIVGQRLGLCAETVRKRLIGMGIERHSVGFYNYDYIKSSNRPDLQGWELNQLIKEEYEKTLSVKQVMINLGLGDLETVRKRLRLMGYETNHRKRYSLKFKGRNNQIMELYSYDHSLKYIAWKLNITSVTVANWLEKSGIRKKGSSNKFVTLLERAEMQPENPNILQAKRIFYWYRKGYKMEDVARIEGIFCNKVSNILRRLDLNTSIRQRQRYEYNEHMKAMLEYVISNRNKYQEKINRLIHKLELRQQKTKTQIKLLHSGLSRVMSWKGSTRNGSLGKINQESFTEKTFELIKQKLTEDKDIIFRTDGVAAEN
ncbi:MAG: hypothetical protein KAU20_07865 [Nanoarchaeota archaeon]|nr:hypothetical protein [Nanoarchaeota archaeon]